MAKKIKRKEVFAFIDSLIDYLDDREKETRDSEYGKDTCRNTIYMLDEFREAHETQKGPRR